MVLTEEATSRYVQVGTLRIHYNEAGAGYPLICIHGGGPGASGWSNFRRNIADLSQHFRTILIDLPGFGRSDKRVNIEGGRFGFYARVVREFMDALGIEHAHFVGNSLGGATALKLALDYPERVDRLVLMGPGGMIGVFTPQPTEGFRLLWGYYEPPGPSLEKLRAFVETMVYDPTQISDDLLMERYKASIDPEVVANPPIGRQMAQLSEELWRDLPRVHHKTLVIWGRDDRVVPYENALIMLRLMPDVQVHIFGRCGHWVQWEHAEEFNRLVIAFLEDGRKR
jgi:pimeloyl-ACP methyl ester carboxylesterase